MSERAAKNSVYLVKICDPSRSCQPGEHSAFHFFSTLR